MRPIAIFTTVFCLVILAYVFYVFIVKNPSKVVRVESASPRPSDHDQGQGRGQGRGQDHDEDEKRALDAVYLESTAQPVHIDKDNEPSYCSATTSKAQKSDLPFVNSCLLKPVTN